MRYLVLDKHTIFFEQYSLVSFSILDTENNDFLEFSFVVNKGRIEQFKLSRLPEIRTEKYKGLILTEDSFILLLSKLESLAKKIEAERERYLESLGK